MGDYHRTNCSLISEQVGDGQVKEGVQGECSKQSIRGKAKVEKELEL